MSQFPLEGGNPVTTRYRGRDVRQVSQPGITETLNAPGVVPLPPQINRNQMLAFELEKALGTLGDLGNSVTRYNAQEQYRKDRAAAALEKKQTEIDAAERGLALSGEQCAAFEHVTDNRGLSVVVGYAGTGKSAMLGVAREAWEAAGYEVRGVALLVVGSSVQPETPARFIQPGRLPEDCAAVACWRLCCAGEAAELWAFPARSTAPPSEASYRAQAKPACAQ